MNGACPKCGSAVEFRKNETRRKCPKCSTKMRAIYENDPDQIRIRVVEDEKTE